MIENNFWKVCEALDCELRIKLLHYLISVETTEFPCVGELAKRFEVSNAAMSIHLKKLALAGLVSSKRADSYVYYRAFATSKEGECVISSLREFFATNPNMDRQSLLITHAHILSHYRRNRILRTLKDAPTNDTMDLARRIEMPQRTVTRLFSELNKASFIDPCGNIRICDTEPEATLLRLTLV